MVLGAVTSRKLQRVGGPRAPCLNSPGHHQVGSPGNPEMHWASCLVIVYFRLISWRSGCLQAGRGGQQHYDHIASGGLVQGRGKGCLSVLSFPASNRQTRRFEKGVSFFSTPTSLYDIFLPRPFHWCKRNMINNIVTDLCQDRWRLYLLW